MIGAVPPRSTGDSAACFVLSRRAGRHHSAVDCGLAEDVRLRAGPSGERYPRTWNG